MPRESIIAGRVKAGVLTKRDAAAIEAVCLGGKTRTEIAKEFNMTTERLRKLMRRPDVKVYIDDWTEETLRAASVKAANVLINQLDNPNAWVAQNAARAILQFMHDQTKTDELNVTVTFTGGMPDPGMPAPRVAEPVVEVEGAVQ